MNSIELKNCNQFYGKKQILHDITLDIPTGQVTSIIGKSGSGKSTLLLSLSQLSPFTNGYLKVLNSEIKTIMGKASKDSTKLDNKHDVGMVFQDYALWPHMNVLDNIILAPIKVLKWDKDLAISKAKELLNYFGIADKALAYPNHLSGGQKQKVAIIRCLIMSPKIILLDEPTAALDPISVKDLTDIILKLKEQGISIIIATHDIDFVKSVSDTLIYIDNGTIKEQGNLDILLKPSSLELKQYVKSFN